MPFQGLIGIIVIVSICWYLSESRKDVDYKALAGGIVTQIILAYIMIRVSFIRDFFAAFGEGIRALKEATLVGTRFVFGFIGGGDAPFAVKEGGDGNLFVFAFQILPMVMVISALSMLLFRWKVIPVIVTIFSYALRKSLRIGGALGVCGASQFILGQTEAPLLIRPYLNKLSRSEFFSVMVLGFATTAGAIMGLYEHILNAHVPNVMGHIITCSIISIPAAITLSRVLIPQREAHTSGDMVMPYKFSNSMDAVARGTSDGLQLFLNIIAMLIVFVALVALVNQILGALPDVEGAKLSLQRILGLVMSPLAWVMGIPWEQAHTAGSLLGTKTVTNEVYAFIDLAGLSNGALNAKSKVIMTYALCGFANFSSIGILIGGLGGMAPDRRGEVIELGFKALLVGTLSTCLSGTIVGLLIK